MKIKQIILIFSFIFFSHFVNGQDLRGGEITIQSIGPLAIETTIILYTQISTSVSRPFITIHWGSGDTGIIATPAPTIVSPDVYQFVYQFNHTYPGPGNYSLYINEPFYVSNITNILNSGSENLVLSKNIVFNPFLGDNNSPLLIVPQDFDWACCNWIHNPGAYDPDGDSLSYSLVPCNVPGYVFPNASVDSLTGDLTFTPDSIGRYAIAVKIDEWRFGNSVGSTVRQMLLDVTSLTGIPEFSVNQFNLFPDPVINSLNISFSNPMTGNSKLEIHNTLGEKVTDQNLAAGSTQFTLDVSQLAQGMYSCRLVSPGGVAVKKFLKLR